MQTLFTYTVPKKIMFSTASERVKIPKKVNLLYTESVNPDVFASFRNSLKKRAGVTVETGRAGSVPKEGFPVVAGRPGEHPAFEPLLGHEALAGVIDRLKGDGYIIGTREEGIAVGSETDRGIMYGLSLLDKMIGSDGPGGASVPVATVLDWPDLAFRGLHFSLPVGPEDLRVIQKAVEELFVLMRINTIVLEVNYSMRYESHPEVSVENAVTKRAVREFVELCGEQGIEVIPQFQCLGHQSWAERTFPLLLKHPEFDETPDIPPHNPDIYCRSWCPSHPDINRFVFDLFDEVIEVFEPSRFHVGMDEVFILGKCRRCKGTPLPELFARAVRDYHEYLAGKGIRMMMWGDRLLPMERTGYNKWEASENDTWKAVDMIPKDIMVTDWHYGRQYRYPSLEFFAERGFEINACPWKDPKNVAGFYCEVMRRTDSKVTGMLETTWYSPADVVSFVMDGVPLREGADPSDVFELKKVSEAWNHFANLAW